MQGRNNWTGLIHVLLLPILSNADAKSISPSPLSFSRNLFSSKSDSLLSRICHDPATIIYQWLRKIWVIVQVTGHHHHYFWHFRSTTDNITRLIKNYSSHQWSRKCHDRHDYHGVWMLPPPSRLSVVMDGARRRFFLPLPSSRPLDFPIRREQMPPRFTRVLIFRSPAPPLLSSHPPLQFPFYYKKDVTYMSLPNTPPHIRCPSNFHSAMPPVIEARKDRI